MNTNFRFALYVRFQSPTVELKVISQEFLGLRPATAMQRAKAGSLPFPTFKLLDSERAPTLVNIDDLAKHMTAKYQQAEEEYQSVQLNS
ncbi:pyocin activator PrtN family protein [Vibrio sp. 1-Bac 57]